MILFTELGAWGAYEKDNFRKVKTKRVAIFLFAFCFSICSLEGSPIKLSQQRAKRESSVGSAATFSVDMRKSGSVKSEANNLSFEELVLLAQEEAKCLQQYGGQLYTPILQDGSYIPYLCPKSTKQTAQCEICRNLTTQIRTLEECSSFCGKEDKICGELCSSINKGVLEGRGGLNSGESTFPLKEDGEIFSPIIPPQVFCEGVDPSNSKTEDKATNHFIVLKWDVDSGNKKNNDNPNSESHYASPLVFVIEKYSATSRRWELLGKTPFNIQKINVSYHSDTYKWRITAVGPRGMLDTITSPEYVTFNGYVKPGPPKKIYVNKTVPVESNKTVVNVLISWDPPEEKACYYKLTVTTHDGAENKPIRIKEPLGVHQYWFTLYAGTKYSVLITSRDPSWGQNGESNGTKLDFKTPTCLESYKYRFDKCAPPPPQSIESKLRGSTTGDPKTIGVVMSWKPPPNTSIDNPILNYNITISRISSKGSESGSDGSHSKGMNFNSSFSFNSFNSFSKHIRPLSNWSQTHQVSGNSTQLFINNLLMDAEYQVFIRAVSVVGAGSPEQFMLSTKILRDQAHMGILVENWLYLAVPMCFLVLIILGCNMARIYLHKRQVKLARNQYFQSMEERDALSADWSIVPLTEETSTWKIFDDNFPKEKWEVVYENLIMGEVIGQGAFGVVRRAKLPRKKLQASTLKYLDKNSSHEKTDAEMETVAVKMLKVSATREDREQLVKEIMTMQSLGFHPQIVGLIGACTRGRSLSLVLEYCPGGDLLTFIRKVRAKYWPTLGLSDEKRSNSLCSIISRCEGSTSMSGTRSCTTASGGGSGGPRLMSSLNSKESEEDNSPINYADLEHFSEYSNSPKSAQGTLLTSTERESSQKSFPKDSSCQSPNGKSCHLDEEEDDPDDNFHPIDEKDVLSYARQIAMGMEYLEKNRIVHRDLACRNCLLMGDNKQVKLSDFGLSRDIYNYNIYHQKSNGKLPLKWMAIESIFTHVFTSKSDVWSYGIVLWELVTLGGTPYPGLGNTELFHLLKSGYRMERPDNSSEELYALMKKCWRTSPACRPNFTELRNYVANMMEAAEPNLYLSLMADIPSDYFRLSSRSDLLAMNDTTEGSGGDFYNGSVGGRGGISKKHYSSSHHPPAASTNSGGAHIDLQSNGAVAKFNIAKGSESGPRTFSRSSSSGSSNTNNASSTGGSANSSFKFTLGSVPERRSLSNGNNTSQIVKTSADSHAESKANNNSLTESNRVCKLHKSLSSSSVGESPTKVLGLKRSPTSPAPFPNPFRQVNNMTIIENKTYGLTDKE